MVPAQALELQIAYLKFVGDVGHQFLVNIVQNGLLIILVIIVKEITEFALLRRLSLYNIVSTFVAQFLLELLGFPAHTVFRSILLFAALLSFLG